MPAIVGQVFYSHDEKSIWVSLPDLNQVREISAVNYGLMNSYDTGEQLKAFAVSPNNRWIAVSHYSESTLWLHDRTNDSIQLIEFEHELSWPDFSADSQTLFVALPEDDEMFQLDVMNIQNTENIPVSHTPNSRGQITYREDPFLIFADNFEGEQ